MRALWGWRRGGSGAPVVRISSRARSEHVDPARVRSFGDRAIFPRVRARVPAELADQRWNRRLDSFERPRREPSGDEPEDRDRMHGDPEEIRPQHEEQTVDEIKDDTDRVPAETAVARGAPKQQESARDDHIDHDRVDRRRRGLDRSFRQAVDEIRDAKTDRETPLSSEGVQDRVQDGRGADPEETGAALASALDELKADQVPPADRRPGGVHRPTGQGRLRAED